jgi:hypothetical protein
MSHLRVHHLYLIGALILSLGASLARPARGDELSALEDSLDDSFGTDSEVFEPKEPGGNLRPSERFARIPIRPQMTDANWRRWAGPQLEKKYNIRRSDSLWAISDRLFGNPYLWPKVWHLNAVFGNPNVIDPGIELYFQPGNPNSAPALAFRKMPGDNSEFLPLLANQRPLSFVEMLDENLRAQMHAAHPPFRFFLVEEKLESAGQIPKPENPLRVYHEAGDGFATKLADGSYNIIRGERMKHPTFTAYKIQWVGTLKVETGHATIQKSFVEIAEGDEIVERDFAVSPLALHEERLGEELSAQTKFVPVQEGYAALAAENMLLGLNFMSADKGPQPGALLDVHDLTGKVATVLIVERSGRMGTAWVAAAKREISAATDHIE